MLSAALTRTHTPGIQTVVSTRQPTLSPTSHWLTAQFETLSSLNVTRSCLATFALRHSVGKEPCRSSQWSPVLGHSVPILLPVIAGGRGLIEMPNFERCLQLWDPEEVHDLIGRILGKQHAGQQNREKKTTDRRADLCPHGQEINQQSHERTRGRSSSDHGRTQKALDCGLDSWSCGRGTHTTGSEGAQPGTEADTGKPAMLSEREGAARQESHRFQMSK